MFYARSLDVGIKIMLRLFFYFILSATLLVLVACVRQDTKDLAPCKKRCERMYRVCSQVCQDNCQNCAIVSNNQTIRNHNKYKHEICVRGGVIARDLNAYRDPLKCRKTTCDCLADYQICRDSCEGIIQKRLQVAQVCC